VNDLTKCASKLPFHPSIDTYAVLKYKQSGGKIKELSYRPRRVYKALIWLKRHNFLYKDIELNFDDSWKIFIDDVINLNNYIDELEFLSENSYDIEESEDDLLEKQFQEEKDNSSFDETIDNNSIKIESSDNEIMLFNETKINNYLNDLKNQLGIKEKTNSMNDDSNNNNNDNNNNTNYTFVSLFHNSEYFYEKCFPTLYPYGYGGPSDCSFKINKNKLTEYYKHVLQNNGGIDGRRFQSNPNFIFLVYNTEMKRRFSNLVFTASDNKSEIFKSGSNSLNLTVGEIDMLINYFKFNPEQEQSMLENNVFICNEDKKFNELETLKKIKNIIRRLSIYSNDLPGTPNYMIQERNKLLAMITSFTILNNGCWRFFLTMTPKDLYDHNLYDIVMKNDFKKSDKLNLEERNDILKLHPCLAARLFKIKQDLIWKYILNGTNKPLGDIIESWRHMEVI
jgi:hypothetical protein